MKCFKIERTDRFSYCEDFTMVVIAKDELHAERFSRVNNEDFKKAKLRVAEIDVDIEQIILTANMGS